jgi:hypothetical protein
MNYSPQQISKSLSQYSFVDVETAIVHLLLKEKGIASTKNSILNKFLNAPVNEGVLFWFESQNVTPSIELLEKLYELEVPEKDRKVNGSYYTPTNIIQYIIKQTITYKGSVCDPACGSGAFLIEVAQFLNKKYDISYEEIYADYLFGVDILPTSVERTKTILSLLAVINGEDGEFFFNIVEGDSLTMDWSYSLGVQEFDFIVGNPPYVRTKNLRPDVRERIKQWHTASFGNVDLYIPFFELSLKLISQKGRIGFITPSTYFTSVNARVLRGYLAENKFVSKIVDFNGWQVFQGATTYTCITVLTKSPSQKIEYTLVDKFEKINTLDDLVPESVSSDYFTEEDWRLLSKSDAEKIFKIENAGSPLFKYVNRFVTGVATLSNDLFIVQDDGGELIQVMYENRPYFIEREITKKIIKPNRIKTYDALKKNKERIIYPYLLDKGGRAHIMSEEMLCLNYPNTYKYLLAIKERLSLRDKGAKTYDAWYAYGRSQGLNTFGKKIILPMMGNKPTFITVDDHDSLIYCGYAIFPKNEEDFQILEKVLNSELMWFYLYKTSKNYSGGFKSFAKNYIKNFSIPEFSQSEKSILLSLSSEKEVNQFLNKKYLAV